MKIEFSRPLPASYDQWKKRQDAHPAYRGVFLEYSSLDKQSGVTTTWTLYPPERPKLSVRDTAPTNMTRLTTIASSPGNPNTQEVNVYIEHNGRTSHSAVILGLYDPSTALTVLHTDISHNPHVTSGGEYDNRGVIKKIMFGVQLEAEFKPADYDERGFYINLTDLEKRYLNKGEKIFFPMVSDETATKEYLQQSAEADMDVLLGVRKLQWTKEDFNVFTSGFNRLTSLYIAPALKNLGGKQIQEFLKHLLRETLDLCDPTYNQRAPKEQAYLLDSAVQGTVSNLLTLDDLTTKAETEHALEIDISQNPHTYQFNKGMGIAFGAEIEKGICSPGKQIPFGERTYSYTLKDPAVTLTCTRLVSSDLKQAIPGIPAFLKEQTAVAFLDRVNIRELVKLVTLPSPTSWENALSIIPTYTKRILD